MVLFRSFASPVFPQSYTHIHTRVHIHARTGIFRRQFLDFAVIFGAQTAIFRLQKHKFSIKSSELFGYSIFMCTFAIVIKSNNIMKHQYQSNYKPNEFLDVVDEFFNGKLKCQISTYSRRGRVKVKTISLGRDALEGQWANFHRI